MAPDSAAFKKKLKSLEVSTSDTIKSNLIKAILAIHSEAIKSIQISHSAGRIYLKKNIQHVASEPGYPPNTDTGNLVHGIGFNIASNGLSGEVGTNIPYGKYLEFGTRKMLARPWLIPAYDKIVPGFADQIHKELRDLYIKKGLR